MKVFFYLHQKAKLLDTKSSLDGYTQISMETPPDVLEYSFYSQSLVDQYWADLRHIALNSNLGAKSKRERERGGEQREREREREREEREREGRTERERRENRERERNKGRQKEKYIEEK